MNTITRTFEISDQQLSDLMVAALEGGINYWCSECSVMRPQKDGKPIEVRPSDAILLDGWSLAFLQDDEDKYQYMDKKKLLEGISKTMDWGNFGNIQSLMDEHDAETADVMVQFALFGEIVYG